MHRYRPDNPKPYTGTTSSPTALRRFLEDVESYFAVSQAPERDKVTFAVHFLRETARDWWIKLTRDNNATDDWDRFKGLIEHRFLPVTPSWDARRRFDAVRQTKSVAKYHEEFQGLINEIEVTERDPHDNNRPFRFTEDEKCRRFIAGLKQHAQSYAALRRSEADIKARCHNLPVMTYNELAEMTSRYDAMLYAARTPRPTPFALATPTSYPVADHGGAAPMQVDALRTSPAASSASGPRGPVPKLSDADREKLRREGACFYCRKPGHRAVECPAKKTSHSGNGPSPSF